MAFAGWVFLLFALHSGMVHSSARLYLEGGVRRVMNNGEVWRHVAMCSCLQGGKAAML